MVDFCVPPEGSNAKTLVTSRNHAVCKILLACATVEKLFKHQFDKLQHRLIGSKDFPGNTMMASSCAAQASDGATHGAAPRRKTLTEGQESILAEHWGQILPVPLAGDDSELQVGATSSLRC
mmetsp:Transcript_64869/g.125163  ORF Transcript_64869/g.125163 Transcript_64869/m.125163 type:complete len:122 (+) Transcript_64869:3-368(+)